MKEGKTRVYSSKKNDYQLKLQRAIMWAGEVSQQ
jgi:hypothetical protein